MTFIFFGARIHTDGFTPQQVEHVSDQDKGAFLKACKSGDLEAAKAYCEQHPGSVNIQDSHGKSGLMLAAGSGAFKVVEYLSTVPGYVVGMEDENWENALFDAVKANSSKIVALLINKKIPFVINKNCKYAHEVLTTGTPSKQMVQQLGKEAAAQMNRETVVIARLLERTLKSPNDREKYITEAEQFLGRKLKSETSPVFAATDAEGKIDFKKQMRHLRTQISENDRVTHKKVVEFFQANPPASIKAARAIVHDRFGIRPTADSLEKLLKWGNIEFKKSEQSDVASEVD